VGARQSHLVIARRERSERRSNPRNFKRAEIATPPLRRLAMTKGKIARDNTPKYHCEEDPTVCHCKGGSIVRHCEQSAAIYNLFRGLYPWPGIWTTVKIKGKEKRLKILDLEMKDNRLIIKKVQLGGKRPIDWQTFARAHPLSS